MVRNEMKRFPLWCLGIGYSHFFRLVIFSVCLTLLLTVPALGAGEFDSYRSDARTTLQMGHTGPDVILMQHALHRTGYLETTPDGAFGSRTRAAVEAFQADHGLDVDGVVGRQTWRALGEALPAATFEPFIHTVVPGDTLWGLAIRYGTTVDDLRAANNLSANSYIYPGQELVIPGHTPAVNADEAVLPPTAEPLVHTVVSGDTLWELSRRYEVSVAAIQEANGLGENALIRVGDTLLIPQTAPVNTVAYVAYTVEPGDSLWWVARHFGVSVEQLREANDLLDSDVIHPGQVLQIPVEGGAATVANEPLGFGGGGPAYLNDVELLHWTEAHRLFQSAKQVTVIDVETGARFRLQRLYGSLHADSEPVTRQDTETIRNIYGGQWSWERRAIIVEIDGRRIAASMNGMPHGGSSIPDNGFNGHLCIHFLGSRVHASGAYDLDHHQRILEAAGYSPDEVRHLVLGG